MRAGRAAGDIDGVFRYLRTDLRKVERALLSCLKSPVSLIPVVGKHITLSGGKRLRPAVLLLKTTLHSYTKPTFKDENHGLVFDYAPGGYATLSETSDGGLTWHNVDFVGPCYNYDIRYIPGTVNMYISVGAAPKCSGASYSRDGGHTWTDYADMVGIPLLSLGVTTGKIGWAGSFNTDEFTGGIFKHVPTGNPEPAFSIDITGGKDFSVNITNVGDIAAKNATVDISITGGFFVTPKDFTHSLETLTVGGKIRMDCAVKGIGDSP